MVPRSKKQFRAEANKTHRNEAEEKSKSKRSEEGYRIRCHLTEHQCNVLKTQPRPVQLRQMPQVHRNKQTNKQKHHGHRKYIYHGTRSQHTIYTKPTTSTAQKPTKPKTNHLNKQGWVSTVQSVVLTADVFCILSSQKNTNTSAVRLDRLNGCWYHIPYQAASTADCCIHPALLLWISKCWWRTAAMLRWCFIAHRSPGRASWSYEYILQLFTK